MSPNRYDLELLKTTSDQKKVNHHTNSIMKRLQLEKMITGNEIMIMADPGLVSGTGLPVIDYIKDPIKPKKKFTTPITIERKKTHNYLKMTHKEQNVYYTEL